MSEPILYILMRNDLPSLNAGKAMAQASHASNAFIRTYGKNIRDSFLTTEIERLVQVRQWEKQTGQGFGTVLVLAANEKQIIEATRAAIATGLASECIFDPTYPFKTNKELSKLIPKSKDSLPRVINGDNVTLYRKEMTCAYIFGLKEECAKILGGLPLHP